MNGDVNFRGPVAQIVVTIGDVPDVGPRAFFSGVVMEAGPDGIVGNNPLPDWEAKASVAKALMFALAEGKEGPGPKLLVARGGLA